MKDEITKTSENGALLKALGGSPAKYRIRRIDRIGKDGSEEHKTVCVEVDDIEAFRTKLKGRKYAEVSFAYEAVAE